jgi:rod shape determining protein RodA
MISSAIIPQPLAKLPWRLIFLVLCISTIGLLTLYSAAGGSTSPWASRTLATSMRRCRPQRIVSS